jgi:hypothetical protein
LLFLAEECPENDPDLINQYGAVVTLLTLKMASLREDSGGLSKDIPSSKKMLVGL